MFNSVIPTMIKFMGSTIVLVLLSSGANSAEPDDCLTASKKPGTCINIKQCPALDNLLRKSQPPSQQTLEFLRSAHCGFDGLTSKVCCELENPAAITSISSKSSNDPTPSSPPDVTAHPNLRLLDHGLCGPLTHDRIFGGNKTGLFDYPWMALLAYQTKEVYKFNCAGSIINSRYVLTAAHCVTGLPEDLVLSGVRLGEHNISTERDCEMGEDGLEVVCAERYQDFGIESVHFHPNYSKTRLWNDIALIRLNSTADFRPKSVRPICLPIGPAANIGTKKVTVTGWGRTEEGVPSSSLLKIVISVVPNDQCLEIYRKKYVRVTPSQICAGGDVGIDSCGGDSGGPLQTPAMYNNNHKYVQYGIVSYGQGCGAKGVPGVYTRLSYYLDWVLDTMRD